MDFDNVYLAKNDHRWVTFISLKTIGLLLPRDLRRGGVRSVLSLAANLRFLLLVLLLLGQDLRMELFLWDAKLQPIV